MLTASTEAPIETLKSSTNDSDVVDTVIPLCDDAKGNKSHVLRRIKPLKKGFDRKEAEALCLQYIAELSRQPCRNLDKKDATKCTCLSVLAEGSSTSNPDAIDPFVNGVINYMIFWAGKTLAERKEKISEWLPYSQCIDGHRCFVLPVRGWSSNGALPTLICKNAFSALLGVGRQMWRTIKTNTSGEFDNHGLKGRPTNRALGLTEVFESLHAYFDELKNAAVPCVVKKKTKYELREDGYVAGLCARLSKRGLYEAWVWRRGYIPKKKSAATSSYYPIAEFEERPFDDDEEFPLFPTGSERRKVISWKSFASFWDQHYKDIVIRKNKATTPSSSKHAREDVGSTIQSPNKRFKAVF